MIGWQINRHKGENMIMNKHGKLNNNKGFTLVEMIVTFAILGLFIISASQIIVLIMNYYYHAKGVSYGREVTNTLTTKICGEIEGAQTGSTILSENGEILTADTVTMTITPSGDKIKFYDKTGSQVMITAVDGRLLIYYYPVTTTSEYGGSKITRYEAVNWTFDEAMYMGYRISELKFEPANPAEYEKNIIKMTLKMTSSKYTDYESVQYIECYNFDADNYNRIAVAEITDDISDVVNDRTSETD